MALSAPFLALLAFTLFPITSNARHCLPSSCGDKLRITSPFRLKTDPENCGDPSYQFSCENNLTVLYSSSLKYFVLAINYNNYTIRVVDSKVQKDNCSSIPIYPQGVYDYDLFREYEPGLVIASKNKSRNVIQLSRTVVFLKCEKPVNSPRYINTAPCDIAGIFPSENSTNSSQSKTRWHYYAVDGSLNASDLDVSCRTGLATITVGKDMDFSKNNSYVDVRNALAYGFEISWLPHYLGKGLRAHGSCYIDASNKAHCFNESELFFCTTSYYMF